MFKNLKAIDLKDFEKARDICVEAFMSYPLHKLIKDVGRRKKVLDQIISLELKYSLKNNQAYYLGHDLREVSIWKNNNKPLSPFAYLRYKTPRTIITLMLNMKREERKLYSSYMKEMSKVRKELTLPDHCFELSVIAVHPENQGEKRASKLLRLALDELRVNNTSCMLVTNTEKNKTMYERFGFKVIKEFYQHKTGISTFFMLFS